MKQYECDLCGYVYDEAAGRSGQRHRPRHQVGGPARRLGVPPVRRRKGRVHR